MNSEISTTHIMMVVGVLGLVVPIGTAIFSLLGMVIFQRLFGGIDKASGDAASFTTQIASLRTELATRDLEKHVQIDSRFREFEAKYVPWPAYEEHAKRQTQILVALLKVFRKIAGKMNVDAVDLDPDGNVIHDAA